MVFRIFTHTYTIIQFSILFKAKIKVDKRNRYYYHVFLTDEDKRVKLI